MTRTRTKRRRRRRRRWRRTDLAVFSRTEDLESEEVAMAGGGGGGGGSRYWRARCRSQWAGKVGLVRQKREGGRGETDSIP